MELERSQTRKKCCAPSTCRVLESLVRPSHKNTSIWVQLRRPPPPFFFRFHHLFSLLSYNKIRPEYLKYLGLRKRSDGPKQDDLHQQGRRGADMSDREEKRGELDQRLSVLVERDSVVAEAVAQSAEGDPVGIVGGSIGLQTVHGPHVDKNESRDVHVGAGSSAVSHLRVFFFLSYLRKE